jgi:hypothetical protein
MRAGKTESPDQLRERYLGEIAPLLAAASNVEALSPVQKQRVRRRIVRTLFRPSALPVRVRLTPVLVGVGLLVAGGVAFATAERLGLIPRVELDPPNVPAKAADAHKRRAPRLKGAGQQGALGGQPAGEVLAGEEAVVVPGVPVPDPSVSATLFESTSGLSLQGPRPALADRAPSAAAQKPTQAGPLARVPVIGLSKRLDKPTKNVALASPYLAEPAGAMPMGSSASSPVVAPPPFPTFQPAPSVPLLAPPAAHQELTPLLSAPSVAPAASPAAESPKRLPSDAALFGQALRKLRNENDPTAALTALQEHTRAYPRSALAGERGVLEVEALLALHRDREALEKLDGMALGELPRSGERFVVRGELRAAARRWQDAKADFDRALARVSGSPAWHERALWGRGVAHLRCGEQDLGMADIERYRDLYPRGRFAAEAGRFFSNR